LILLDIGLPGVNGIEAARRIGYLAPKSKILFLSQEISADVVQEALSAGAPGYVVKAKAGDELFPAIEAVISGEPFLSAELVDRGLSHPFDGQVRNRRLGGNLRNSPKAAR
jgi:DNA-binding NarL/FixJ family response regulator